MFDRIVEKLLDFRYLPPYKVHELLLQAKDAKRTDVVNLIGDFIMYSKENKDEKDDKLI